MVYKTARRVVVFVTGTALVLAGIIMFVTPGPGIAGVLGGLALLATEFVWARWLLKKVKKKLRTAASAVSDKIRPATTGHPRKHEKHK